MSETLARGGGAHFIARTFLARRAGNLIGFLACAGLLGFGYYLQFAKGLEPCPLCIIQRLLLLGTGLVFLIAAIHHPGRIGSWVYGALTALVAAVGVAVATRHVWLQHTPADQRPSCGPGLDFLLSNFGPLDGLQRILRGSGECGAVDWTFLGLSIPEWTLGWFVVFVLYGLFLATRE
jgi:disulfide bond formation protein DsbB